MDSQEENVGGILVVFKTKISESEFTSSYKDILDDELLEGFLRGKKYHTQLAFDCLLSYLHSRTNKYKEFTRTHLPSSLTTVFNLGKVKILKQSDPKGRPVVYDQVKLWNPSKHNLQAFIAELVFTFDEIVRTYSKTSSENRVVLIINTEGSSFQHARQATPRVLLQMIDMLLNNVPLRPDAIHILNESLIVRGVFNLCKPYLKDKIRNRFHFHSSNLSSLHKHVPRSILPKSLGGELLDEEAFDDSLVGMMQSRENFYKQLGERS